MKLHFSELKTKIIDTLQLLDITPDDVDEDGQLVEGELGIDSIDVLELVMMIEKDYSVRIDNRETAPRIFATLRSLAAHIHENAPAPFIEQDGCCEQETDRAPNHPGIDPHENRAAEQQTGR